MSRIFHTFFIVAMSINFVGCASLKEPDSRGLGLTRTSFGALNPERLAEGISMCNQNSGVIVKAITGGLMKLIDPLRNATGTPDETLAREELTHYFSFVTVFNEPVIRIIQRNDESIDFWFIGDAIRESNRSEKAAEEYCKLHENRIATYAGFSYKCGQEIPLPIITDGTQLKVTMEERIVAYNCVESKLTMPTPKE